jgi:hypothetical protein
VNERGRSDSRAVRGNINTISLSLSINFSIIIKRFYFLCKLSSPQLDAVPFILQLCCQTFIFQKQQHFLPKIPNMHFQALTIISLAALSVALPASLQTRQAGVLKATTFNDISIAGGKAGNAEQEAADAFSALDLNDLANVSKADLDFLNEVNQVANDAEKEAFNPAVEAATGTAADAAQVRNT